MTERTAEELNMLAQRLFFFAVARGDFSLICASHDVQVTAWDAEKAEAQKDG